MSEHTHFSESSAEQSSGDLPRCRQGCLKRSASLALCLLLMLPAGTAASSRAVSAADQPEFFVTDRYIDVSSADWFADSVQKAYDRGLMNGTTPYTFEPDAGMTRAMFAQILYNMYGKPDAGSCSMPFRDVDSGVWYYDAVRWGYHAGIISGISKDLFAPDQGITREQAAQLIYSASGGKEGGRLSGFSDAGDVDDWARNGLAWAVSREILGGSSERGGLYLNPRSGMKRSEGAKIISKFYEVRNGIKNSPETEFPQETHIHSWQMEGGVRIPVLEYHEVSDNVWGESSLFVSPSDMRKQLKWLKDNGYQAIFFSDLTHLQDYSKPVLLTFDDGYAGNYDNLFPLLKEFGMKATVFVITGDIGYNSHYLTAGQIREMSDSGLVSVQSHTNSHSRVDWLTDEQLIREYQTSKMMISKITGKSPYVLSYPNGINTESSRKYACDFFSFAVRGGRSPWVTDGNVYRIPRSFISRKTSFSQFKKIVGR